MRPILPILRVLACAAALSTLVPAASARLTAMHGLEDDASAPLWTQAERDGPVVDLAPGTEVPYVVVVGEPTPTSDDNLGRGGGSQIGIEARDFAYRK